MSGAEGSRPGAQPDRLIRRMEDIGPDRPMPGVVRKRIVGAQMMVSRVLLEKGVVVPVHSHANEQITQIVSGRVRFTLGPEGAERVLGAGDWLELPADYPHGAEVLEDTEILDLFSPPSEKTGVDAR